MYGQRPYYNGGIVDNVTLPPTLAVMPLSQRERHRRTRYLQVGEQEARVLVLRDDHEVSPISPDREDK